MAQFTKYTGTVTGQNGSLITALDAILVTGEGWTKVYGDANNGAYQAPSGNQLLLRVEDDGPGGSGAKEARITGYETMSDIDTGTGPFPTAAQGVGGVAMLVARKSNSADATARNYVAFADERTIHFFCLTGDTAGAYYSWSFGEIYSYKTTSDDYRTLIIGRIEEANTLPAYETYGRVSALNAVTAGHFCARSYTGAGTSLNVGKHTNFATCSSADLVGIVQSPNGVDGGLYVEPVYIHEISANIIRGQVRGLWCPAHALASFNDGDIFSGVGALNGKTFYIVKTICSANNNVCSIAIETSNTLDTN